MLTIRTAVKASPINGLGLFLTHHLSKGAVVWRFHPKLDRTFTENFLETIPQAVAESLRKYCYINPDQPELLVLCGDDARFLNFPAHETPANLALGRKVDGEFLLIAARDIAAGEELTVPLESDADASRKLASSI